MGDQRVQKFIRTISAASLSVLAHMHAMTPRAADESRSKDVLLTGTALSIQASKPYLADYPNPAEASKAPAGVSDSGVA